MRKAAESYVTVFNGCCRFLTKKNKGKDIRRQKKEEKEKIAQERMKVDIDVDIYREREN